MTAQILLGELIENKRAFFCVALHIAVNIKLHPSMVPDCGIKP